MKKWYQSIILVTVACLAMRVRAVTPDEISKMQAAMPTAPAVKPQGPRKLLVINLCNGFKHSSIPYWDKALEIMGQKTKAFAVTISSDMSVFNTETLQQYDAVCLNNTTHLKFTDEQKQAFMAFIKEQGKGLVGIHAATDNFYDWPEAARMIGGTFTGHPWSAYATWAIKIDDPNHPLTKPFAGQGFKINDEIYRTDAPLYGRTGQRVLMSLDMSDPATRNANGVKPADMDTGISWIKRYGKGRIFHGSMGHTHHITWNRTILEHYLAAIQFAMGDLECDTTPIPSAEEKQAAATTAALLKKVEAYDFGESRAVLVELEKVMREFGGQPGPLAVIEMQLLGQLRGRASAGLTDFICRQLSLIGAEQAVDVLIPMLTNPRVADMARYALERIPGAQVDQKLRSSLSQVPDATRVGIVATLGVRRDNEAVSVLAAHLSQDDVQLATAAAAALGRIGTPEAGAALLEQKDKVSAGVQQRLLDALLSCAEHLLDQDKPAEAAKLYERLSQAENSRVIRIGALRGLAEAKSQDLGNLIVSVLEQEDRDLTPTALSLIARIDDAGQIKQVGEKMADLSEPDQVRMLASMAQGANPAALPYVKSAAKNRDQSVRAGALKAIAVLGDRSCVAILANAATDSDMQRTARESLYRMSGPGVDDEILRLIKESNENAVQVELIQSVSARGIGPGASVLLEAARGRNRSVQRAAFKALAVIGRAQDIPVLTTMLMARPQRAIEDALVAIAETHDQADQVAESVLSQANTASDTAKQAALRVLARLGDDRGLGFVEQQVQASNQQVRTAAVRALSTWSTRTPLPLALRIAQDDDNLTRRILAFRGYVSMAVLPSDDSPEQVFALLARAMAIAARDEEKKMVLSALPKAPCKAALDLAQQQLKDPQLRAEAQTALVGICDGLAGSAPQAVKDVLTRLLKSKMNKNVEDAAQRVLKKVNN